MAIITDSAFKPSTHDDVLHQGSAADSFMRDLPPIVPSHWRDHLHYLLHLTYFSDTTMILLAEHGLGKTTFVRCVADQAGRDVFFATLDASDITHPAELLPALSALFQIDTPSQATHDLATTAFYESLAARRQHALLVIDNASALPLEALEWLQQSFSDAGLRANLHCVLCAEPSFMDLLQTNELHALIEQSHVMSLQPWSPQEVHRYIDETLSTSGFATQHFFSPDELARITEQSGGIPLHVKRMAIAFLHDKQQTHIEPDGSDVPNDAKRPLPGQQASLTSRHRTIALIGLLGCLALCAYSAWQIGWLMPMTHSSAKKASLQTQQQSWQSTHAVKRPLLHRMSTRTATPYHPFQHTYPSTTAVAEPNTVTESPQMSMTAQRATTQRHTRVAPIVAKQTQQRPRSGHAKQSIEQRQLQQMNRQHYALQLMGVRSKQQLMQFVARSKLDGPYYYVQTRYRNHDWYVLMYGDFKGKALAVRAIKHLPQSLQAMQPWPRKLSDLQK